MSRRRTGAAVVELTERAMSDLREVERYSIAEWGRRVADKYLRDIEFALDRIRENPDILRLEPEILPGLQFYRVRKHLLVCFCTERLVIVLTVMHTSMDLPARLLELEPGFAADVSLLRDQVKRGRRRR